MKFFDIKRFKGTQLKEALDYLGGELSGILRDLFIGLGNLDFIDNFNSWRWDGTIGAGATVTITNPLGLVPRYRLVVRAQPLAAGTVIIDDSLSTWTTDSVYLKNGGTASAAVSVVFIR